MFINIGEKLRKINDSIYQEAIPPADRSRPLEWRRNFNSVRFPLKAFKVFTTCSVNDLNWSADDDSLKSPYAKIKPAVKITHSLQAAVDSEVMKDSIYSLKKTEDKDIFVVEKPSGGIQVNIREGAQEIGRSHFPDGVFIGNIFRVDYEPGKDYICLDAIIPSDQIQAIFAALRRDPKLTIELIAHVLSFTYEVDDALRESYHRQDLLISDSMSAAPIHTVTFSSVVGDSQHANEFSEQDSDKDESVGHTEKDEVRKEPTQTAPFNVVVDLAPLSKAVSSISTAIWIALVFAVLAIVFK